MSKSAEAFRTISEVADELGVPKHVLRFWEVKFSHVRPMKRGGGRRLYRPEDMALLCGIRHLLHREGYTIKGVQKILREQGVDAVKQRGNAQPLESADPQPTARTKAPAARGRRRGPETARSRTMREPADMRKKGILAAIDELEACKALLAKVAPGNQRRQRPSAA